MLKIMKRYLSPEAAGQKSASESDLKILNVMKQNYDLSIDLSNAYFSDESWRKWTISKARDVDFYATLIVNEFHKIEERFAINKMGRIRAEEFKTLKHPLVWPLVEMANAHGYYVRIHKNTDHMSDPYASVGELARDKKRISVSLKPYAGRNFKIEDVCFILAHEVCHAVHIKDGLFAEFYNKGDKKIGIIAERDCDAFAAAYVKRVTGKKSALSDDIYPAEALYSPDKFSAHYELVRERLKPFFENSKEEIESYCEAESQVRMYAIKSALVWISYILKQHEKWGSWPAVPSDALKSLDSVRENISKA